jgi:hypothetical protein
MFAIKKGLKISSVPLKNFSSLSAFRKTFYELLNKDDALNTHYQTSITPSDQPLKNHHSQPITLAPHSHEITVLPNGIRILTESQSHPSKVNIGILLNVGTRDETLENSGSMLSIHNTYMKTVINTNETVK